MFQKIAERIYMYLSKKNILSQEDKDVYIYALEVIVLNTSLLATILLISLSMKQLLCFICFLCFFVPLRIFCGGYHAKRSEICFPMSMITYVIVLLFVNRNLYLYQNIFLQSITFVIMLLLFLFAPLENKNHPLDESQLQRNQKIVRILLVLYFLLLSYFSINQMLVATYEIAFVILNGILFFIGKWDQINENIKKV